MDFGTLVNHTLQNLYTFSPLFIALFLVFGAASSSLLRLWLAVPNVQLPIEIGDEFEEADHCRTVFRSELTTQYVLRTRKSFINNVMIYSGSAKNITDALLWSTVIIGGTLVRNINDFWSLVFFVAALLIPCTCAVYKTICDLSGTIDKTVIRKEEVLQILLSDSPRATVANQAVTFATSIVVSGLALVSQNTICIAAVFFSLIYTECIRVYGREHSTKGVFFGYIFWSIFSVTILAVGIRNYLRGKEPQSLYPTFFLHRTSVINWPALTVSILSSFLPFSLISLLLRFDYSAAILAGKVSAPQSTREDKTEKPLLSHTPIARVPRRTDFVPVFPKPYFAFSLFWYFLACVCVSAGVSTLLRCDSYELVPYLSNLLSAPFMAIGSASLAFLRGEWRAFWMYKENWGPSLMDDDVFHPGSDAGTLSTESSYTDGYGSGEKVLLPA